MMSTMCSKHVETKNKNKYIERNLCVTLVIYQESLRDARSTKYKILQDVSTHIYRMKKDIRQKLLQLPDVDLTYLKRALTSTAHVSLVKKQLVQIQPRHFLQLWKPALNEAAVLLNLPLMWTKRAFFFLVKGAFIYFYLPWRITNIWVQLIYVESSQ